MDSTRRRGDNSNRGRQNQRENETSEQRKTRLEQERKQFLEESSQWGTFDVHTFDRWIKMYEASEKEIKGLNELSDDNMNASQKKAFLEIGMDIEYILTGEQTLSQHELEQIGNKLEDFDKMVRSLGMKEVDRTSQKWSEFRQEAYDDIVNKFKTNKEVRSMMLTDIMQVERGNICSQEQRESKEYKIMVGIVMAEWGKWKKRRKSHQVVNQHKDTVIPG